MFKSVAASNWGYTTSACNMAPAAVANSKVNRACSVTHTANRGDLQEQHLRKHFAVSSTLLLPHSLLD
jgi:hypothetical protein